MSAAPQQGQVVCDGDVEEAACLLDDPADGLQVTAAVPGEQQAGGGLGAKQRVGFIHTYCATHCTPLHWAIGTYDNGFSHRAVTSTSPLHL